MNTSPFASSWVVELWRHGEWVVLARRPTKQEARAAAWESRFLPNERWRVREVGAIAP